MGLLRAISIDTNSRLAFNKKLELQFAALKIHAHDSFFKKQSYFSKIFTKYNEVAKGSAHDSIQYDGSKLALFNSAGYLEIAIYRSNLGTVGGASTLLGLQYRDSVIIDFINDTQPDFTPLT